ncbi:MAG: DUF362 domain-containing protein [Bacillota bacterium]|nr:DUF362 domain-containing protein [Bacillota bacterium]
MPVISVARAAEAAAEQRAEQRELLTKLLQPLAGVEFFVMPGESVLILSDVCLPAPPSQGVHFPPDLLAALVELIYAAGAARVGVALRPAAGFPLPRVLTDSGYAALAESGAELIDLSARGTVRRSCADALSADHLDIAAPLALYDVLISAAKLRVSEGRLFGGAIVNCAAACPAFAGCDDEHRQRMLVDIYGAVSPDLSIIDCRSVNIAFQPPRLDCLLAGHDAVAIDMTLATLCALPPANIEYLQLAAQYGLGSHVAGEIMLRGDKLI